MGPNDIIHVNADGFITSVTKAAGAHRVFQNDQELRLNDPSFDSKQIDQIIGSESFRYTADWAGEDKTKLFTTFTNKQMADKFNNLEFGKIRDIYQQSTEPSIFDDFQGVSSQMYLASLGVSEFDFADDMASFSRESGNANPAGGVFPPDGTNGFVKFESGNMLYNGYDAGNFLTGKGFQLIGGSKAEIQAGADINNALSIRRRGFSIADSNSDQQAISAGFDYNGVQWKK